MKRKLFLTAFVFLIVFCLILLFHAYNFTHPVDESETEFKPAINSFTERAKAAIFGIRPIKKPSAKNPADYGMNFEAITFKSTDDLGLSGWLIKAENPKGTVIITHGYSGNKEALLPYSAFLSGKGYNTFLFDFRGAGNGEGNYVSMGYYERLDVLGAIKYLESREDLGTMDVYGLGLSMGGAALIMAEIEQHSFKAIVVDSLFRVCTRMPREDSTVYMACPNSPLQHC